MQKSTLSWMSYPSHGSSCGELKGILFRVRRLGSLCRINPE